MMASFVLSESWCLMRSKLKILKNFEIATSLFQLSIKLQKLALVKLALERGFVDGNLQPEHP